MSFGGIISLKGVMYPQLPSKQSARLDVSAKTVKPVAKISKTANNNDTNNISYICTHPKPVLV